MPQLDFFTFFNQILIFSFFFFIYFIFFIYIVIYYNFLFKLRKKKISINNVFSIFLINNFFKTIFIKKFKIILKI